MKKAFTLVELIVVIGIIAVLAGVLLATFSGGSESARAARCLTNMRNLAAACQSYAMKSGHYPLAGSVEKITLDDSRGVNDIQERYYELPGWIGWYSQNVYQSKPTTSKAQSSWYRSMYDEDDLARIYCLTNGVLWSQVSGNHEVYRCPAHVKRMGNPNWSYVMNSYFGWTAKPGSDIYDSDYGGHNYARFQRSDRFLLFAEIPFHPTYNTTIETSTSPNAKVDCILQYEDNEMIGFNHKTGKKCYAHVVFADGHTEKLVHAGLSDAQIRELTQWLCTGKDISFDGSKYEKLTD